MWLIVTVSQMRFRTGKYLPCPKSPGQQVTELQFACKALLLTTAVLLPSFEFPGSFGGKGLPAKGRGGYRKNEAGVPPASLPLPARATEPPCTHLRGASPSCCLAGKSNCVCEQTFLGPPSKIPDNIRAIKSNKRPISSPLSELPVLLMPLDLHMRERAATKMTLVLHGEATATGCKGKEPSPWTEAENEKLGEKEEAGDRKRDLSQAPNDSVQ